MIGIGLVKRTLLVAIALLLATAVTASPGCSSTEEPGKWLEGCRKAVDNYVAGGGYLHIKQEVEYGLETTEGSFQQKIAIEGDDIFPERQAYEYHEAISSSQLPGQAQENSFSYLTLDGGRTAYVKGEQLSTQLEVVGWVHYTPPEGQNRYFDYPKLMEGLTSAAVKVEWVGYEDVDGIRCAHLLYAMNGQELLDLRMQEDPTLQEKFQGIDLNEFLGDLQVEIWIRESDDLPQRVIMDQALSVENSVSSTTRFLMLFSGYGEGPPILIEQPAFYSEAG